MISLSLSLSPMRMTSRVQSRVPEWAPCLGGGDPTSYSVITLLGRDGVEVTLPATLLLATSHLLRSILSDRDHVHPAYSPPAISLPVTGAGLNTAREVLVNAFAVASVERWREAENVFKLLGIESSGIVSEEQGQRTEGDTKDIINEYFEESEDVKKPITGEETVLLNNDENVKKEYETKKHVDLKSEALLSENNKQVGYDIVIEIEDSDDEINNDSSVIEKANSHVPPSGGEKEPSAKKRKITAGEQPSVSQQNVKIVQYNKRIRKFCCNQCDEKFGGKEELVNHYLKEHELCRYKCFFCGKLVKRHNLLIKHTREEHGDEMVKAEARLCVDSSSVRKVLWQIKTISSIGCSKKQVAVEGGNSNKVTPPKRISSLEKKAADRSSKRSKASVINYEESGSESSEYDKEWDSDSEAYESDPEDNQCGKVFPSAGNLKLHRNVHKDEKERPFKCGACEKSFSAPASLKNHELLHTGESFKCEFCSYNAVQKGNLKRHRFKQHKDLLENNVMNSVELKDVLENKSEINVEVVNQVEEKKEVQKDSVTNE